MPTYAAVIGFPAMNVGICVAGDELSAIVFLPRSTPLAAPKCSLSERAVLQIERYRDDPEAPFDLPLERTGTPLQRAVWAQISAIPRGRTRTYGELSAAIDPAMVPNPRTVGQACGDNPFPIVVPCHRVVAADGLGGFAHHGAGYLIETKTWLLRHECLPLEEEAGSLWHGKA
jgi:methylated-DNA-[protein]-cysteine S-methyltransferase